LCALILIGALIFGLYLNGGNDAAKPVAVALKTDPPDADVLIDGQPAKLNSQGKLELLPGKYQFKFSKADYKPVQRTKQISTAAEPLEVKLEKLKSEPAKTASKKP